MGEILKFEAVCKLLTICLVYPLLYGVYCIYAASEGLNFNSGVASAFSSPAGVVVLLVVAVGAVAFVFWELSTVVRIVALTRQGQKFTWRELWWGSLWGLGALRGWSLPTSALFYLGVLPLAGFGYVNSLLPTLSVPEFIFSELRRYGSLGMAAMILLPALGYLLAAALVFVPLSMALGRRTFFQATRESLLAWGRSFRREGRWSGRGFAVLGALLLWLALFTKVAQYWRRNRLGLVDFDAAFFRNLLYSEAFRIDFAYWVVRAVLDTAAMALFIRVLLAVAAPQKAAAGVAQPHLAGGRRRPGRGAPQAAGKAPPLGAGSVEALGRARHRGGAVPGAGRLDAGRQPAAPAAPPAGGHRPSRLYLRDGKHVGRCAGRRGLRRPVRGDRRAALRRRGAGGPPRREPLAAGGGEPQRGRPHRGGAHLPATAAHGLRPGRGAHPHLGAGAPAGRLSA